jgi:hypothetical protein
LLFFYSAVIVDKDECAVVVGIYIASGALVARTKVALQKT